MTIRQLHDLRPYLNLRALAEGAGLSYEALNAKLYRYGAEGRRSELTAPEGMALDAALARLLGSVGYVLSAHDPNAVSVARRIDRETMGN